MSTRLDPQLLKEIKEYGSVDVEKCFNCGNCTAICPMSSGEDLFPRKLIRFTQVGLKEHLIGSKELWLCYNCGQCSETCPKQAEPAAFMMAARNYAIANYDFLGIAKLLASKPIFGGIFLALLNVLLFMFMYTNHGPMLEDELKLFEFLPYEFIHSFGLWAIIFVGVIGVIVLLNMIIHISKAAGLTTRSFFSIGIRTWWLALWEAIGVQVLGQKRYRQNCEDEKGKVRWYLTKWFVHASVLWGFLGLLMATALDYLLDILTIKPTGTFMPIWHPIRFLGTVSGALLVYGVSVLIFRRFTKSDKAHSKSTFSDWVFLILLWVGGVTGFVVELSLYLPEAIWGYWMLLVHVSFSMELLILLPFTKFAHAILRTTALFVHSLQPRPVKDVIEQPAAAD